MAGAKGASGTARTLLEIPSTVTTSCAGVSSASADGTSKLICFSLLKRIVPGSPLNVAPMTFPVNALPITETSEPGTAGTAAKLAPLTTDSTVGIAAGAGAGAGVTTNVTGIVLAAV